MAKVTTDLVQQNPDGAYQAPVVIAVNADGSAIGGGSGSGGGSVEVSNFPVTQPVSGPLTSSELLAVTGAATDAMWNGTDQSATLIALLKNIQEQGEALKRIGNETNTLMVQVAEHTRQIALNTATP